MSRVEHKRSVERKCIIDRLRHRSRIGGVRLIVVVDIVGKREVRCHLARSVAWTRADARNQLARHNRCVALDGMGDWGELSGCVRRDVALDDRRVG